MRLLKNSRLHLLLLATSIFVISSILGLSAYLADMQTFYADMRTPSALELGFSFTGTQLQDQLLTPGKPFDMPVGVKVSGVSSLYAFIDFDPPEGLIINGFNSTSWHPITEGGSVYYYGTDSGLVALDKENNPEALIFSGVTLTSGAGTSEAYPLTVTGYVIQTDEIPSSASIADIFQMAKDEVAKKGY